MKTVHRSKVRQRVLRKRAPIFLCLRPPEPPRAPKAPKAPKIPDGLPCLVTTDVSDIGIVLCFSSLRLTRSLSTDRF